MPLFLSIILFRNACKILLLCPLFLLFMLVFVPIMLDGLGQCHSCVRVFTAEAKAKAPRGRPRTSTVLHRLSLKMVGK